ncbi:MAG: DUF3291 domain-containing protein [Candidatus Kapaibacterium sp.]|nr:MAG: DUF3291 domain-containing protein [Candidatus Kapabacteria bacterium]
MHIAQLNIARMLAPMESDQMKDFREGLEPINALGEQSRGFVWRLKDENDNATEIRIFDDEMVIVNLTVWESLQSLFDFAYKSNHADFVRRRAEWFEKSTVPMYVLWQIAAGHIPSTEEAKERLEYLQKNGDSAYAFQFKYAARLMIA